MFDLQRNVMDYASLVRASKRLDPGSTSQKIRIALLSDAATQQFVPLLRTLFHRQGIDVAIYEGAFDAIQLEAYGSSSGLYQFDPEIVVVLNCIQALRAGFAKRKTDAAAFAEEQSKSISAVWDAIQGHLPATILQSNFVLPYERHFGNFDHKVVGAFHTVTVSLNTFIDREARLRPNVLVNDVEAVASWIGRRYWFDDRLWDLAKAFCALENLPAVAANIVDIVMSTRGRVVKCVVTDLDNTLWGGVIGDDGVDGIVLNAHGDGEAFYRLQAYLKELARRGILLAVCSKNEMNNALLPFEKHPDMLLKRDDFAVIVANWNDKADNLRHIREVLNIGFDSMVFLDDNPFERNLIRGVLPEVIVPELPEDPADYVRAIAELNLFETTSFSAEDLRRTDLYRAEAVRRDAQAAFGSAEEFLRSLDMRIVISRFDPFHLPRIAQLIQRSNQFNLTTHRYSEAECESLMNGQRSIPLYVKLADRLGDHGLIGIVVLEPVGDELVIRDWLMSCRVLARGVEQYIMNMVVEKACRMGLAKIRGEYIKTKKNDMVRDFFAQFGFTKIGGAEDHTHWALAVDEYQSAATFIQPADQLTAVVL
jgi:FkbH-like protein